MTIRFSNFSCFSNVWQGAGAVLRTTAALLWPSRCTACGAVVPEFTAFCEVCVISVLPVGLACPGCALPNDGDRCGTCTRARFSFASATAVFAYGGAIADAIVKFKHAPRPDFARPLGRLLSPALRDLVLDVGARTLVPVPVHRRRLRRRGFNQALALLRCAMPKMTRDAAIVLPDALERVVDTPSLGHGTAEQRRQIVAGAFRVGRPTRIEGRSILLVDDVLTTGATASACASALLKDGARSVHVLALARAL